MAGYSRVVMVGNMTRDAEIKYIRSDLAVAEIGIAINEKKKAADGSWVDDVTFVDVTLWGRTAEVCSQWCSKGSQILVEGRLKLDSWEDKTTGQKRTKLRVVGEKLVLLGSKPQQGNERQPAQSHSPAGAAGPAEGSGYTNDDIPF